jgi:branched-chain amino acid transport system ATP-binding protein
VPKPSSASIEVRDLQAGYGPLTILRDLSLDIPTGKVTAIVGPNGAGKTTLLRAIMGVNTVRGGSITLDGQPTHGLHPWEMAERGVVMVQEGRGLFREMSVEENILLGAFVPRCRVHAATNLERIYGIFPRLKERRRQPAGKLSGGEAQMVAIGQGLMAEPRVFLVDEPSLGLSPRLVGEIFQVLERLKESGITIALVEQHTKRAIGIADHVHLMLDGRLAFSAPAAEVDLARLHELYFAREAATHAR